MSLSRGGVFSLLEIEDEHRTPRKGLQWALAVSLVLHALALFVTYSPDQQGGQANPVDGDANVRGVMRPRLEARLGSPAPARQAAREASPENSLRKPSTAPAASAKQKKLTAPSGVWANRTWTRAERAEMDKFLNELSAQAKPPSGRELAQKALATARQMGRVAQQGREDGVGRSEVDGQFVEPLSLEMYFDAFIRKLNRSAAFVKNDPRPPGSRKALVEIALNPDGSLKSYRILRSGDQEAEIAYIKSVVDRAAPFSAFPPDIRKARASLSILMCIYPPHMSGSIGFSRSFGDQDCQG
jgi:hypothetical protein